MQVLGLSQAELGRRVGISQASIYNLVSGKGYGSKHLHLIARELRTTPAYLTGETDDPESGIPDQPLLSTADLELLEKFALLSERARGAVMTLIDEMAGDHRASVHGNRHTYRAQSRGG